MSTPRIGIDARLLYYRKGGIAEYTRQLIHALDTDTQYSIIHNFRDKSRYTPAPNCRRINALTPCHHRWERTALAAELWRLRLDLFHSPDFIPPRRLARRHVITIHDLHFLHYPQFQTADSLRYYRDQIRLAVQQADHIFAQSNYTKNEIMAMLGVSPDKITVHGLGVNPAFQVLPTDQVQQILAPYNLPTEYLLFVGTIEPRKNLPGLLRAYRQLGEDVPPLVLAGQRGWFAEQELALSKDLPVTWLEDVPFEVLPAVYNGAHLLILPSFTEGFGLPAVEAMACGTPVVVSERGALPEVVGEWGVYINPDEPDSIADGITQLLDDPALYEKMRTGGLTQQYNWQHMASIVLETYRKLL